MPSKSTPINPIDSATTPIRRWPYAFYLITGSMALGYGSILTLFAEFKEQFGFSESALGLIAAVGFLAGFLAQVGFSRYADRGYAAFMVRMGVIAALGSMIWMSFADQLWQFVLARSIMGMAAGVCSPAIRRVVICRDEKNMGANLGRLAGFDIAGFTLGPVIAAVLASTLGIRAPFIALAILYGGLFFVALGLDLHIAAAAAKSKKALRQLIRIPAVQVGLLIAVCFYATIGSFEVSWALLLDDLGAGTWLIGVSLSLFTVPMIFMAPRGGKLAHRIGPMRVMVYSVLAAMLCTLGYGWFGWLWVVLAISLLQGFFDAFTLPGMQVQIAMFSPSEHIASGQGLLSAVGLLVAGLVSGVGGTLYDSGGPELLFTATAGLMAVALVFALLRNRAAARI